MKDYKDKIAVITGAASGIGRALAEKCAAYGMHLVLADMNEKDLNPFAAKLMAQGIPVLAERVNVSKEEEILAFAHKTLTTVGPPDLLFNNAGIGGYAGPLWELSAEKLRFVLEVNLMSVFYGVRAFLPMMMAAKNDEAHIINTASMAGFYTFPSFSSYEISKHGVIVLSECLYHDLSQAQSKIRVSVLCPGGVNTAIMEGSRRYLDEGELNHATVSTHEEFLILKFLKLVKKGIDPSEVADYVFQAIAENKFYIFTHPYLKAVITERTQAILNENTPACADFSKIKEKLAL
jgi:NAD(P)-dependent dehydrogenase (short-subunit alcohol dehydrogenase family)